MVISQFLKVLLYLLSTQVPKAFEKALLNAGFSSTYSVFLGSVPSIHQSTWQSLSCADEISSHHSAGKVCNKALVSGERAAHGREHPAG